VTEQKVVDMNRRLDVDVSLNAPVGDADDAAEWHNRLIDEASEQETRLPDAEQADNRRPALVASLSQLNDQEQRTVEEHWLTDDPPTLEELAAEFGVSRERVRHIEMRTFQKVQKCGNGHFKAECFAPTDDAGIGCDRTKSKSMLRKPALPRARGSDGPRVTKGIHVARTGSTTLRSVARRYRHMEQFNHRGQTVVFAKPRQRVSSLITSTKR
jgi:Sigma-70, region 4